VSPTSCYLAVINRITKQEKRKKILVFCDLSSITCDVLSKLSEVDDTIEMRIGHSLLDDVRMMLCADQVAVSHGSFQLSFPCLANLINKRRHTFYLEPPPRFKSLSLSS